MRFKDQVVIITGATGGLGADAARSFAREGARLLLVDRDDGAALAAELGARFHRADVTRDADVAGYVQVALDAFGRIDVFFNNAGIEGRVAPITELTEADFDAVMGVNVKGVFLGLRHVLPVMLSQRAGAIVNTGSTASHVGSPGLGPYVASKHAVLGLTRVAAVEAARAGVRVNAVCPGPTETRMIRSLEEQAAARGLNDARERYMAGIPLGRYCTPAEVTAAVMFLCSAEASGITGTHLLVDGGRTGAPSSSAMR